MAKDLVNARLLIVVLLAIGVAILLVLIVPQLDSGDAVVRRENGADPEAVLAVTRITLDAYRDLVQLVGAAFGVVSFLLGYQSRNRLELGRESWQRLSLGVLALGTALLLALLGREQVLTMLARDAVNLGGSSLLYLRWGCYMCFVTGAVLISAFAVAAANAEPPRSAAASTQGE